MSNIPDETPFSGLKILLVDDSDDNRYLISRILKKRGAHVDVAENGREGVEKALVGEYTVVLMDIQMPEMDGYAATESLRAAGYSKPVIALTAHATNEVRDRCLKAGCSDHIAKPIGATELTDKIVFWTKS